MKEISDGKVALYRGQLWHRTGCCCCVALNVGAAFFIKRFQTHIIKDHAF
jgi:hypothetical protein